MIVRKSPRDMTAGQRNAFIKAVVDLKNEMNSLSDGTMIGSYDQHVAVHIGVTGRIRQGTPINFGDLDGAHGGPGFLPWHREYLLRIEKDLQRVSGNPDLTIPYWDWGDHDTTFNIIFQDNFLGKHQSTGRHDVTTARFTTGGRWKLDRRVHVRMIIDLVIDPSATIPDMGETLFRESSSRAAMPTRAKIEELLTLSLYDNFRTTIEHGTPGNQRTHDYMHGWVGGTMGSHASPYDPIFVLNHAFIDRMWALWQALGHNGASHYTKAASPPYGHGLRDPMWPWDGTARVKTVDRIEQVLPAFDRQDRREPRDVLDCKGLNYSYVDYGRVKDILDNAIERWKTARGRTPRLAIRHGSAFKWNTKQNLLNATALGRRLIDPAMIGNGRGHETNLVVALLRGVQNFNRMPSGGPFLPISEIAEITHWIDMGTPG